MGYKEWLDILPGGEGLLRSIGVTRICFKVVQEEVVNFWSERSYVEVATIRRRAKYCLTDRIKAIFHYCIQ